MDFKVGIMATNKRISHQHVKVTRGSDLKPEPISWLWMPWLALGKLHILSGASGSGKTTISMALAAIVSTGGYWPDGSQSSVGNVVIWSGEDDPQDTLLPRLMLAGADRDRIHFITGIEDEEGHQAFDPAVHVRSLMRQLKEIGDVCLLIIPIFDRS